MIFFKKNNILDGVQPPLGIDTEAIVWEVKTDVHHNHPKCLLFSVISTDLNLKIVYMEHGWFFKPISWLDFLLILQ